MPYVRVPRTWNIIYYNGSTRVRDDQLAEIIQREIQAIHDITVNEGYTKWEKGDTPLFFMQGDYCQIEQVYVDDKIHLSSFNHIVDVLKDNRFWVIEKWLKNVSLSHYKQDDFVQHLRKFVEEKLKVGDKK